MPNVFKRFLSGGEASDYIFQPAASFQVTPDKPGPPPPPEPEPTKEPEADDEPQEAPPAEPTPETDPISFARIQANAILEDARAEVEEYKAAARAEVSLAAAGL